MSEQWRAVMQRWCANKKLQEKASNLRNGQNNAAHNLGVCKESGGSELQVRDWRRLDGREGELQISVLTSRTAPQGV
jgi:hypothetical protein